MADDIVIALKGFLDWFNDIENKYGAHKKYKSYMAYIWQWKKTYRLSAYEKFVFSTTTINWKNKLTPLNIFLIIIYFRKAWTFSLCVILEQRFTHLINCYFKNIFNTVEWLIERWTYVCCKGRFRSKYSILELKSSIRLLLPVQKS